jgi:hypothetical protein
LTLSIEGPHHFNGYLKFMTGVELSVKLTIVSDKGVIPAKFEAIGEGKGGETKGSIYELTGWVFRGADGQVVTVRGSVRAVRGPERNPDIELGKKPINTVGEFIIHDLGLQPLEEILCRG